MSKQESKCCFACEEYEYDAKLLNLEGAINTAAGKVPRVSTILTSKDIAGWLKVRCAIGRKNFRIKPGLYAAGNPDKNANVIVTSNYKMSFDYVRRALNGRNEWILVLDTQGVNVWCAAGKGTFGTEEIISRIQKTELEKIVEHRRIILPQLGAPGVCSKTVATQSGFKVKFGPVRAIDLPQYLDNGLQANSAMRRVTFPLIDRAVLTPVELILAGKYIIPVTIVFASVSFALSKVLGNEAIEIGKRGIISILAAWIAGSILNPLALPVLPGRSFSVKGTSAGFAVFLILWTQFNNTASAFELAAWGLLITAIASFIAMNFTGSSTYTSPSGVRKEMKYSVPCQLAACLIGLALLTTAFIKLL